MNVFTVDVEDWFHARNVELAFPRRLWSTADSRVEKNVDLLLEILERHTYKGTWFVLGLVAERFPRLVRRIAEAGHEIASHGYNHELVYSQRPDVFREDVHRTKCLLESITAQSVYGYRAPNFSICDWAIDILQEAGHLYDSSLYPVPIHDRYGRLSIQPSGSIQELRPGFFELPLSLLEIGPLKVPCSGGAYFRLLPGSLFSWCIMQKKREQSNFVFYIHPWELDPSQPRLRSMRVSHKIRHYTNLKKTASRVSRILGTHEWTTAYSAVANHIKQSQLRPCV